MRHVLLNTIVIFMMILVEARKHSIYIYILRN